jgi:hypothetical protein
MVEELLDLMPHKVRLEPNMGSGLYTTPTLGNPIENVPARVVYEEQKTTDDAGQEVIARGHIHLGGVFGVTTKHRITLPDGTQPPIVRVKKYPDELGDDHEVILFA